MGGTKIDCSFPNQQFIVPEDRIFQMNRDISDIFKHI